MDEGDGERPTKLQKVDHDVQDDRIEPVMSGAIQTSDVTTNGQSDADGSHQDGQTTEKLSKNQLKKLRRKQRWEEKREQRKLRRKEKLKARKERRREQKEKGEVQLSRKAQQARSVLLPITFVIDCGWDEYMLDHERISLSSQLTRCYSDNSRAPFRGHLIISSFNKLLKERFDTVLAKTHENWKGVRFLSEDFVFAASLAADWMKAPGSQLLGAFSGKTDAKPEDGEVVYLSSESPNTLTELKPYSTYIVGGLVDKNRHKGVCYKRATELGIKTAKLPIGEYLQMSTRKVLATNHVVEIMLRWLELGDWGEAFLRVIPKRKGGVLKPGVKDEAGDSAEARDNADDTSSATSGSESSDEQETTDDEGGPSMQEEKGEHQVTDGQSPNAQEAGST
ncbi:hypothetical protein VTN49DRAFT_7277 [Thermomyces lanuginosus]|uniref:uncharacterized protein n=1 Tax=Thermomyces lanuginosus TaxID=5541 RepID=UPI0037448F81